MKQFYPVIIAFLLLSCSNKSEDTHESPFPVYKEYLINWSEFYIDNFKNYSFPIWFHADVLDSLNIESIRLEVNNFTELDTLSNKRGPSRRHVIDFQMVNGGIKQINHTFFNLDIPILENKVVYKKTADSFGYNLPRITEKPLYTLQSSSFKSKESRVVKLIKLSEDYLKYVESDNFDIKEHIYLINEELWTIPHIDNYFKPDESIIFYYGTPKKFIEAFTLKDLVKKDQIEEREYYENGVIRQQFFHSQNFVTQRVFQYDSIGKCVGFIDSLKTSDLDFIHFTKSEILYKDNKPVSILYFNEEDVEKYLPFQEIKIFYTKKEK
ncbi:MAG: hypothetical protein WC994_06770 [Brumimicrobium sp.]